MATQIAKKITGYAVVKPEAAPQVTEGVKQFRDDDADRRIKLETVPTPAAASLRWESRPDLPEGNDGKTYLIRGPEHKFCVQIGHVQNGHAEPFEVWVLGEAPRGLSALAKSLSMDMRSRDRQYLERKLEALNNTKGTPFDMRTADGRLYRCRSEVAAFAKVISWRCKELGVFDNVAPAPLLDALMSSREPKTTSAGATAHYWDIANPATGDNFAMFVKELDMPSGQRRPFSVWFSGDYPESLDGLCKALSYDLRVVDVEWAARKLRQLLTVTEDRGEFFAEVPGTEKKAVYPSTVAYIAALLLHRMQVLGLLRDDGKVVAPTGAVHLHVVEEVQHETSSEPTGLLCGDCGAYAVRKSGGCDICEQCGASHCGG